jgi:hypothetical protein
MGPWPPLVEPRINQGPTWSIAAPIGAAVPVTAKPLPSPSTMVSMVPHAFWPCGQDIKTKSNSQFTHRPLGVLSSTLFKGLDPGPQGRTDFWCTYLRGLRLRRGSQIPPLGALGRLWEQGWGGYATDGRNRGSGSLAGQRLAGDCRSLGAGGSGGRGRENDSHSLPEGAWPP